MERSELAEMLDGARYQGYGVSQETLVSILESHLALLDKFERVVSCR